MSKTVLILATGLFLVACAGEVFAGNVTYQGQNSAIFANANSSGNAALMASVNRPKDPSKSAGTGQLTPTDIVEQGVLSQLSNKIYTQIFTTGAGVPNNGVFTLADGSTITYLHDTLNGLLTITFNDRTHGQTVITLPE